MKNLLLIVAVVCVLFSCEDDYIVDGGTSDSFVGTSTMEFLKAHTQLDTMAILLERAGLSDEVNGSTTLFVANNLSIRNYVEAELAELRKTDPLAEFTVDDIPTDTLVKYMGSYVFPEKITRKDMLKEGKIYTALNGETRRISLEPDANDYKDELSDPPEYVYLTYKKGDDWDDWDNIEDDTRIIVRTSDLISTNGVIHVLQGTHVLFNRKKAE